MIPGQSHTKLIAKALKDQGLDKKLLKAAFTEAQIKLYKDYADQLEKLYKNKKFGLLDSKAKDLGNELQYVLQYTPIEVVEKLSK